MTSFYSIASNISEAMPGVHKHEVWERMLQALRQLSDNWRSMHSDSIPLVNPHGLPSKVTLFNLPALQRAVNLLDSTIKEVNEQHPALVPRLKRLQERLQWILDDRSKKTVPISVAERNNETKERGIQQEKLLLTLG